jgi:excinuclease ABC B subunit
MSEQFQIQADFKPTGDQPRAIRELVDGLKRKDKYQTLLGATGTGKSIGFDDSVFVQEEIGGTMRTHVTAVGPLLDAAFEEHADRVAHEGDHEVLRLAPGTYRTQAYDPRDGSVRLAEVSAFTRHAAPDDIYCLTTTCGRKVTLTGSHNLWVLRDGSPHLIETADLRATDSLPLPERLAPGQSVAHFDLIDCAPGRGWRVEAPRQLAAFAQAQGTRALSQPLRAAGVGHVAGAMWSARGGSGSLKRATLNRVLADTDRLSGTWNAEAARVRVGNGRNSLPARLPLTRPFLRLLGLYLAEGHASQRYVLFSNHDEKVRSELFAALDALKLTYSVRPNSDIQVSSTSLTQLLRSWCGGGSAGKHLPLFWADLSDDQLGALLSAYFDGDGTVGRASEVTATTASERLASDLQYALLRLGIWGRRKPRRKRATNSDHAGGVYQQITLSGQEDLRRFRDLVGFTVEYKRQRLERECGRDGNSNVDVVAIDGALLRTLRTDAGLYARELGVLAGVTRSAVQSYETQTRRPARQTLRRMCDALRRLLPDDARLESLAALAVVRWTGVASLERIEYLHPYVYDFTVPGPETFLAGEGGLFVHNTFTASNVVAEVQRPTLVMSHNKTLAAQLYAELKGFFPNNAVEFFISYYDYYQPEAYIVHSDTYIEKDMAINEKIDRLRLRATSALVSGRRDVIVVASVSCIYGLGSPDEYKSQIVQLRAGRRIERDEMLRGLVNIFYSRNDIEFVPGNFRVRGDVVEVFPAYLEDIAYRISMWGDEIERLTVFDPLTGKDIREEQLLTVYPARIFVTPKDKMEKAMHTISEELKWRLAILRDEGKMLEAARLEQRTMFDLEMMREVGYCAGIENYSRHMTGHEPGQRPYCLFDYFPDDYLLLVDESHVSIPQVRAMYNGDRARKLSLVEHGFRLPSALDNRPMTFEEYEAQHNQVIFVSATPGDYELEKSDGVFVEQVIRPTGIPDPVVEIRPIDGQIDDLLDEIRRVVGRKERTLVTTLTKRMAEDLAEYLDSFGIAVRYLHSDIDALERVDILRDLRLGVFDVLIGVNLLREGLDLPEVSLVAILDADKEGFLRSDRSLIQTAGRAARNADSKVIMYADRITGSMQRMMDETDRRRELQLAYNEKHGITPRTVVKSRDAIMKGTAVADEKYSDESTPQRQGQTEYANKNQYAIAADPLVKYLTPDQKGDLIVQMTREMEEAAESLEFERAADLRDQIDALEKQIKEEKQKV